MAEEKGTTEKDGMLDELKLTFRIPQKMPSVYATQMTVQSGPEEVILSFFEVIPPVFVGDRSTFLEQISKTGIITECVARITVSPQRFVEFTNAMQQHLAKLETTAQAKEPTAEGKDANDS